MAFLTEDHDCPGWRGEMAGRIRAFNWSDTELGAIDTWTRSLSATVKLLLASPVPLVMLWGQRGYMIYNDAYAEFAGGRHPYLLGAPVELGWPEIASFNRHVMDTCLGGATLSYHDKELVLLRNGQPENVWMDLYYSPVADDDGAPAGVIAVVVETTRRVLIERHRQIAEAALRDTNERLQLALNAGAVLGTWVWDIESDIVRGDERFARTFMLPLDATTRGIPRAGMNRTVHPGDVDRIDRAIHASLESGEPYKVEYRIQQPDGRYLWIQANGRCEFDREGAPYRFPGVLIDIHERKIAEDALRQLTETLEQRVADALAAQAVAEEQLRQAQKMEAIGSLTGGVAHDFNNVLQVINGNLQMLAATVGGDAATQRRIRAATDAVQRGGKLAAQLLAFARRQPLSPAVVNPRRLLDGMDEMLHRVLGETVRIHTSLGEDLWNVLVDQNQLENALLNLAINGRDAMQGDGTLTIAASNVVLSAEDCRARPEASPGDYLTFSVSDTGVGMPPEVLEHVFEPFFTTKPDGRGTGLGLSMVFGFVKQSGGHTTITSEVGRGTTVKLFFPRCDEQELPLLPVEVAAPVGGRETILVVEDDADVRLTAVEMLTQLGYKVLTASGGDSALELLDTGVHIDLLFTDVVMPGTIHSAELAQRASALPTPVPVLFTSGYTRDVIFHQGKLDPGVTLLGKPYRRDDLARKVRGVLDAHRRRQAEQIQAPPAHDGNAEASAPEPTRVNGTAVSVLLVEDDPDSRAAMRDLLVAFGLQCTAVHSAEEAIELVPAQRYDVLLTDITLPGMSGSDLARTLRRVQPGIRVVLVSGYGDSTVIGDEIPGALLLPKPVDIATLRRELTGAGG
ncbi:response regulator [Paraburkholderia sp. GAS42]|jgi:signal transduction histidine kinase/DNA-binding response OmpR family regulator|uniref:hybrid sensor histidine kinase/response regulator n=1 Tax=Paraburkholderia sp. GAS42 TaxID=3035135 RepID=UPI003D239E4E